MRAAASLQAKRLTAKECSAQKNANKEQWTAEEAVIVKKENVKQDFFK